MKGGSCASVLAPNNRTMVDDIMNNDICYVYCTYYSLFASEFVLMIIKNAVVKFASLQQFHTQVTIIE